MRTSRVSVGILRHPLIAARFCVISGSTTSSALTSCSLFCSLSLLMSSSLSELPVAMFAVFLFMFPAPNTQKRFLSVFVASGESQAAVTVRKHIQIVPSSSRYVWNKYVSRELQKTFVFDPNLECHGIFVKKPSHM